MSSPRIGRVMIVCAACLGILAFARESGPKTAPPPRPAEVRTRALVSGPDLIEVSVQLPEPHVVLPLSGGTHGRRIELSGSTGVKTVGDTELPIIRTFIAIPDCDRVDLRAEVHSIEKSVGVSVRLSTATSGGSQHAGPEQAVLRHEWARLVGIQRARGQALALIEIQPLRYNRGKSEISCPREIRLRLNPVNPRGPVSVDAGPLQFALSAVVPNLKGFIGRVPPAAPNSPVLQSAGQVCWCNTGDDDWGDAADYVKNNCAADYLIIVADELLADAADSSLVEQLATKRAEFNGFNVAIVRMGQIDSTPANTDTPETIRLFVKEIYDDASAGHMGDDRLGYLLLLGDAVNPAGDVILPSMYFSLADYRGVAAGGYENGMDGYFAFMDGPTELVPDILVGRLPVDADDDDWELTNVVNKITSFEPIEPDPSTQKILLMSGGSDAGFTFVGEGLSGFEAYFDAIEAVAPASGKTFVQMHRLAAGSDLAFSKEVCDSIASGYGVIGLFDHANPVNFENAFFPLHYDTLRNTDRPSLVLSFGSHSGFFDYLGCTSGCCYPSPSYPGLPCQVPTTPIDSVDAIAERLILQADGAIGVVAYGRTNSAPIVQQAFANAFRALLQHKQGELGSLVLTTKLLTADTVTSRALNLLGDPALNINYEFDTVSQDSVDLAVSGMDMAFPSGRNDFAASSSAQSMSVVVANKWKDTSGRIPVEIWMGVPDAGGSTLLNSFTINSLPGLSDTTWTGSIGSFSVGDHDIYVVADPEDTLEDPIPTNNVSYRTLHIRDYASGFPIQRAESRVELIDAVLGSPRDLEIAAGGFLFAADGSSLTGGGPGPGGNLFRSNKRHFISIDHQIAGSQLMVLSEAGSAWQDYWFVPGTASDAIVLDHGLPDSMLVAVNGTQGTDRKIRLYTVAGALKWSRIIGSAAGGTLGQTSFSQAAGDITGDGMSDVVYALIPAVGSGADSLGVLDGKTGARVWAVAISDEQYDRVRVRLVDIENDGTLEIIINTRVAGSPREDRIQCYGASGSLLWQVTVASVPTSNPPFVLFAPADVDHDGQKEIIFVHNQRFGIITVSGVSASISTYVDLTGYRAFQSTPLAVDIDGDDLLEFIVFSRVQDRYLNEYRLELRVYDDDLSAMGSIQTFPWTNALGASAKPPVDAAAGDIDGDGVVEVVFTTPDGTLHAVRVGSSAGRGDWTSADGDAQRTGLFEQVIGGDYSEHVAIHGRARVVSDAEFIDGVTITAPADVQVGSLDSLVVEGLFAVLGNEDDSVRVRIDEVASPGSYWGGFVYDNGNNRGNVRYAVVSNSLVGFDHTSPLKITGSRISNVSGTAIVAADSLWLWDSEVTGAGANGVELGLGAVARIERSLIEDLGGSGVVCDSCAATSQINESTVRQAGVHGAYLQRVHGFLVDASVFEDNESAGIRFESADGLLIRSRMEGNAGGVVCLDHSSPVVEECRIDQNSSGVAAAEDSYPVLGYGSIGGRNCITNSTGYLATNLSAGWIYAHHDYYGSICCKSTKLFGNVSCDSCETSSVCDGAAAIAILTPSSEPEARSTIPKTLDLVGVAPNPFNPTVRIRFGVPAGGASVQLVIYNVRGQRVTLLENGRVPSGYHERVWDGTDVRGERVASGVYFLQMRSTGFQKTMKIVLLK